MSHDYKVREFPLGGLTGISDQSLAVHLKLYRGYVEETNRLNDMLSGFLEDGRVDREEMPVYSELRRRLGFEYNGMVLHEYYFEALKRGGGGDPQARSRFRAAVVECFGSYDTWRTDFMSVAKMRGVGWAICYQDPKGGQLSNHWITLHETGPVAGFMPILVLDVWEHAFMLDYEPAERPKYIDAFFANVDWSVVERRVEPRISRLQYASGAHLGVARGADAERADELPHSM
jgi:Fe-Mn family superoxide dismutase